ncbi:MAG: creatininase family protein [Candidatus Riflebacteria bacterium]|nr:creatininase family protein [Candidatus Riflebacteria bacterium]
MGSAETARPTAAGDGGGVLKLEELSWKQLDALDRETTLVVLPVSPVEEHGPHLPLGTDVLSATHMALALGRELLRRRPRSTVLLYPTIPVGTWTLTFVGSVEVRQRVIRDLIVDVGASLARHGFKNLMVVNGHGGPGHVVCQEEACGILGWRHGVRAVAPLGRMIDTLFAGDYTRRLGEAFAARLRREAEASGGSTAVGEAPDLSVLTTDFHAGLIETSLMLHVRPELVDDQYRSLPSVAIDRLGIRPSSGLTAGAGLGYLGHPAQASAKLGEVVLELAGNDLASLAERLMDGEDLRRECRSRLHWLPFFWTNAGLYAVSLVLWICVILYLLLRR